MTGKPSSERFSARRAKDFQRVYKACESCRKKKIRCVLDGSGNPPGPPCARCKRERRECIFSLERSVRKRSGASEGENQDRGRGSSKEENSQTTLDDMRQHNGQQDTTTEFGVAHDTWANLSFSNHGTQQSAAGRISNLQQDSGNQPISSAFHNLTDQPQAGADGLTDTVMRTVVSSGNDALKLLFQAAEQQDAESPQQAASVTQSSQPGLNLSTPATMISNSHLSAQVPPDVLQVWDAFRFVKMGWFSAEEAITYFDLFGKNLAPLSPVCQGIDLNHSNHYHIITQEPLLCCTILMISSRYHILPGAGGVSRATLIHQRLWEHCQHLIMRIIFGQEKRSKAKTRTIGAIEALLFIIEWHPKAIHFPPAADGWDSDLILSSADRRDDPFANRADVADDPGARWLAEVAAPARMSDRMSWMLLGCAQSLAHEMGIYEAPSTPEPSEMKNGQAMRKNRIKTLLFIFIEQLSSRLGCTSMVADLGGTSSHSSSDTTEAAFLSGWIELTRLLRTATDVLFPSAAGIKQLLRGSKYVNIIKHFQQQLVNWRQSHLKEHELTANSYQEISIEYHNLRLLINSFGMQALVERGLGVDRSAFDRSNCAQLSLNVTDYDFIQEVVDGSCQILRSVNKLSEIGHLRFCPVRIFLRTITASIFLLKALSLGTHVSNLQASLAVLEQSIQALHASSFDDMHLASRYATLLDRHVARFRQGLVPSSVPKGIPLPFDLDGSWDPGSGIASNFGDGAIPDFVSNDQSWMSLPFDPSMAPFELTGDTLDMTEFDDRAWDFLWNLPEIS